MHSFMGNTKIIGLKEIGDSYLELELNRPEDFTYKSGQYTKLYFPDLPDKPIYLSIASQPSHDKIELCIMVRDESLRRKYLDAFNSKMSLRLDLPEGKFLLPSARDKDFIFVAGGSGISPVRSMLLDVLSECRSSTLLIGARSKQDIPYFQQFNVLQSVNPQFTFLACTDQGEGDLFKGNVVNLFEHNVHQFPKQASYYLCGPKPMLEAFSISAEKMGIHASNIFWETY